MMRIGIDIRRAGSFGVGAYIQNLVSALARVGAEEEYILIGQPGQFEKLGPLPGQFRSQDYARPTGAWQDHLAFALLLKKLKLDVFHMPHRLTPYFLPRPCVVTLHDINNILYPKPDASKLAEALRRRLLTRGLKRADRVMAVSQATKRAAVKHLGLSPENITVVADAPDARVVKPVTEEERHRILMRYRINDPFVFYAGRIQIHKNIPRLIEAFAVVKAELANHPQYKSLRLIIIGDEMTALPEVRHAVLRARIQPWVRFLGFVPLETLRVFYATATAFLFPSLCEGFGLPPLEAMSHGTPVITSNVSSLPEVVGDAAMLVSPENVFDIARGLRQVLLDDALRVELRRRGLAQTRRFSWDASARQVLEVYRSVAIGPSRERRG